MIERLVVALRQLAEMPADELASDAAAPVRGDCADALRLELDCPQQSLAPAQRAALTRLSDALETGSPNDQLAGAVRAASRALDVATRGG
jgi:hypothetical protein